MVCPAVGWELGDFSEVLWDTWERSLSIGLAH